MKWESLGGKGIISSEGERRLWAIDCLDDCETAAGLHQTLLNVWSYAFAGAFDGAVIAQKAYTVPQIVEQIGVAIDVMRRRVKTAEAKNA